MGLASPFLLIPLASFKKDKNKLHIAFALIKWVETSDHTASFHLVVRLFCSAPLVQAYTHFPINW